MRRPDLQAYENIGYIADRVPGLGITQMIATAAPTNGTVGFAKGCLWQNTAGSLGSLLYVNSGTQTSATWNAVT